MQVGGQRKTGPAAVSLGAAIVTAVAWFLPWETFFGQGFSLFNIMQLTGRTTLGTYMILGGPVIAGIGAGYRVMSAAAGRRSDIGASIGHGLVVAASLIAIAGFPSTQDGQLGAQVGIGAYLALVASGVGLAASIADYRSMPRGMTQPWAPAGAFSAPPGSVAQQAAFPTFDQITVTWSGRSFAVPVLAGQQAIVGSDPSASIRLLDPGVGPYQCTIQRVQGGWLVRDLGCPDPTRLVTAPGVSQPFSGEVRLGSGQLQVGQAFVTLPPVM